jgi:predicted dehydrogenase
MRIGIVGAGTMGRVHAAALQRIAGVEVTAFGALAIPERTVTLARELGAALLPDAEALLARPDIDAVVVATPTDTHHDMVIAAARAGKQIFCEKPLARTLEQGAAMIEAVQQAGVRLAVGQVVRYFPAYAAAHELVLAGELGTPGVARATRGAGFPRVPDNWYGDLARSGGVVLDLMIHDLDWLRWTLGPVERLYARGLSGRGLAGKDAAMAVLRFSSGALGYAEGNWAYPSGFRTTLEVSGSAGLVRSSNRDTAPLTFELEPAADGGPAALPPLDDPSEDPYLAQLRDAVAWFAGGSPPRCPAEDAFESLRLALAALDSIHNGQPVVFSQSPV